MWPRKRQPLGFLDPNILMTDRWQMVLAMSAAELDTSTADIENRHAHCKQTTPSGTVGAELVSAKYVLRESKHLHMCCHKNASSVSAGSQGDTQDDLRTSSSFPNIASSPQQYTRQRLNGMLYFHFSRVQTAMNQELSGLVTITNPCSRAAWAQTRDDWSRLTENERTHYHDLARTPAGWRLIPLFPLKGPRRMWTQQHT